LKRIGILYHPKVEATLIKAREVQEFLISRSFSVWLCSAWEKEEACQQLDGTDLVLTVGGDGTILRAAQVVFTSDIPIAGVNLGKLGFMTELDAEEALSKLPSLVSGDGWTDERGMLQVELATPGQETREFHALNDVVVARGEIARVIRVETVIDGQYYTTYKADGVILATATGSTGYTLAAGGPVLHPQSGDYLLQPVAPHLGSTHALVLPGNAEVSLSVTTVLPATIGIDGHINLPVSGDDIIKVKRSPNVIRFRRIRQKDNFYGSLEEKLKGRESVPGRKG